jgi:TDG/mug DNA glycosylase family protein
MLAVDYMKVIHNIDPVFDDKSQVLILGSCPSVISRKYKFYYANKQNRFWPLISDILNEKTPDTVDDKKKMLLNHGIALWDIVKSCDIQGSSDNSIKDIEPNDISLILEKSEIKMIVCNGNKSYELFEYFYSDKIGINVKKMPSTSSANASYDRKRLMTAWSIISNFIK